MMWTVLTWGLVALPAVGMLALLADIADARRDLHLVREEGLVGSVQEEQAKHNFRAQASRAAVLTVIGLMALLQLVDVLTGEWLAALIYVITIILVADSWRARLARKKMIRLMYRGG